MWLNPTRRMPPRRVRAVAVSAVLCRSWERAQTDSELVGKDVPAELNKEGVVVTLVRVLAVVMRLLGSVGDLLLRVDRSDRAHVGLVARGT